MALVFRVTQPLLQRSCACDPIFYERLSVDDLKEISADFAAICRRVSEHPILVLPSVFPIDE